MLKKLFTTNFQKFTSFTQTPIRIPILTHFQSSPFSTSLHTPHQKYEFDDHGKLKGDYDKTELFNELKYRFDLSVHKLPEGETYDKLLDIIYSPEDAVIVKQLTTRPERVDDFAKRIGMDEKMLNEKIDGIAYRGLIIDLIMGDDNARYVYLPEYIVGWMETTINWFLKNKQETIDKGIDFRELMHLYYHYNEMYGSKELTGKVKTFRAAPYDLEDDMQFVDYETAVSVIERTDDIGLLECICKGLTKEKGDPFDEKLPVKCCMVLTYPVVEAGVRIGLFERIKKEKALEILKELRDLDHCHCVHNSKNPTSICNCHKDYCQLLVMWRKEGIYGTIEKSQFIANIDHDKCISCGNCVKKCSIDVVKMWENEEGIEKPIINEDMCLGCGLCVYKCSENAIKMVRRDSPPHIPNDYFTKICEMAFEKNKLNTLLFANPDKLSHKIMRKIFYYIEANPFSKAMKSLDSVNSIFLKVMHAKVKREEYYKNFYKAMGRDINEHKKKKD